MERIKRAWRGEEPLWKVFWVYGFLGGIVLGFVKAIIENSILGMPGIILYWIVYIAYLIWNTVSQWRCAFNAGWRGWGYIVRALIILGLVLIPLGLLAGGLFVGQDLVKAAECRKEARQYAANGGEDVEAFKQECLRKHMPDAEPQSGSDLPPMPPVPVGDLPVKLDSVPEAQREYYRACQEKMIGYARDRGAEPKQYVTENQSYLKECVQFYIKNATKKTIQP